VHGVWGLKKPSMKVAERNEFVKKTTSRNKGSCRARDQKRGGKIRRIGRMKREKFLVKHEEFKDDTSIKRLKPPMRQQGNRNSGEKESSPRFTSKPSWGEEGNGEREKKWRSKKASRVFKNPQAFEKDRKFLVKRGAE